MSKQRPEDAEEMVVLELDGPTEASDEELSSELIDLVLEARSDRREREQAAEQERAERRIDGVVIGRLVDLSERGPLVHYPRCPALDGLVARSAAKLSEADVGRRVALMFEGGEVDRPMLLGLIEHDDGAEEIAHPALGSLTIEENDQRIEFKSDKPIALRSGESSIVLTPKGRILLKGKYVLSRASVTNRIRGGTVRIN